MAHMLLSCEMETKICVPQDISVLEQLKACRLIDFNTSFQLKISIEVTVRFGDLLLGMEGILEYSVIEPLKIHSMSVRGTRLSQRKCPNFDLPRRRASGHLSPGAVLGEQNSRKATHAREVTHAVDSVSKA